MTGAEAILDTWARRDERYLVRRYMGVLHRLSENEAAVVREHRAREARALAGNARLLALIQLDRWMPPL